MNSKIEETMREKAMQLINDFCECEYGNSANFRDMRKIALAYTTTENEEMEIQVYANLIDLRIERYLDEVLVDCWEYDSLQGLIDELEVLDFDFLVSIPGDAMEKVAQKGLLTEALPR